MRRADRFQKSKVYLLTNMFLKIFLGVHRKMEKIKTIQEALLNIKDGMKIMTAGFLGIGAPLKMIDALAKTVSRILHLFNLYQLIHEKLMILVN